MLCCVATIMVLYYLQIKVGETQRERERRWAGPSKPWDATVALQNADAKLLGHSQGKMVRAELVMARLGN